jgi:hypothetical protein
MAMISMNDDTVHTLAIVFGLLGKHIMPLSSSSSQSFTTCSSFSFFLSFPFLSFFHSFLDSFSKLNQTV